MSEYIDVRQLLDRYEERECWNCGNVWIRVAKPAESICSECFKGQGDHENVDGYTDYGELWYGEIAREEMKKKYQQTREEMNSVTGHVTVRI